MSPAAHISSAYILGGSVRKLSLAAVIIGGVLPDIDFLFILFPWFNEIHRMVTHNLLFILLFSAIGAFLSFKGAKLKIFISLALGGILHLMLDMLADSNSSNGIGLPLFWPFWDKYFLIVNLAAGTDNPLGWRAPLEQLKFSFRGLLIEFPFIIGAAVVFFFRRKRGHRI